jgi:transcriptional regulator with XRE-family HTH domain
MRLGKTIRTCREARGLKQYELAENAGLSESYLSLVEKDKREPSLSSLDGIASALGVPLSVLIFLAAEGDVKGELSPQHVEEISRRILSVMSHAT